ncbi:neuromedin-U receptor 1-like [Periophthalmus magnuspinnatus]|uniref:neuromedin-U receptor 1-like n=1 Tax=Periophthalmus magnuspinnatus TaxID=409849 RepID=UPI00145B4CCC|nr:neuromedin-U receptor 1-like [Periophthalmus magnuspinnatus]
MLTPNCSLETVSSVGSNMSIGCPHSSLLCGINMSLLVNVSSVDLDELCLSEDEYLALHLGPLRSPIFAPVCVTYLSIFLVGVLGNSLTCAVILRYKAMQTPTNLYLLSLALSDLLVLLLGMPLELWEMWRSYPFPLGEGGCYFKTFLFETVCFASVLNVTALSVERYIAVVHPLKVKSLSTRAHVKRVIVMLWVMAMICAVPNTSLHGILLLPPKFGRPFPRSAMCYLVKPTWMYKLTILISSLAFFVLPVLVMGALYFLIGLTLYRERGMKALSAMFGVDSVSEDHMQRLSRRNLQVTKMLCVLVVVFSLCWAPFHVDRLMWSFLDTSSQLHLMIFEPVHIVSGVFFYLSSAVNPVLYSLMSTRFREMFSHLTCPHYNWLNHSSLRLTQRSTLSHKAPSNTKELS